MKTTTFVLMTMLLMGCKPKVDPDPGPEPEPLTGPEKKVEAVDEKDDSKKDTPSAGKDLMKEVLTSAGDLDVGTKVTICVQVTQEAFPPIDAAPWKCEAEVQTVQAPWDEKLGALSGEKIVEALDRHLGVGGYADPKIWGTQDGSAGPKTTGSIGLAKDGSGFYDNYVGKTEDGTHVIFVFVKPAG